MRNALLPPVSSQLYAFGNNEIQMPPNLEVSMQMDAKVNVDGSSSNYMESKLLNNDNNQNRGHGGFAFPYQSLFNHQPAGYQSTSSSSCDTISHKSMLLAKNPSVPHFETELEGLQNARKRPIHIFPGEENRDLVGNKMGLEEWKKNKRKKVTSSDEQWHLQVKESSEKIQEHRLQVPVRRSQKLGDKITALQKLVSPYGKTDTASVLQEASLYIKLLQDQIKNLFQLMSNSYNSVRALHPQENGEKQQLDLRSRGLCLVPISFTHRVTKEEQHTHHSAISRKFTTPTNFYYP